MRRTLSNSVAAAVKDRATPAPLEPPATVKLRKGDRPFWDEIVKARARDEWPGYDLVVAAQLARCQADVERFQQELDAGSVVGADGVDPLLGVIEQLVRRELSMMRVLRLAGRDAGLTTEKDEARRRVMRRAEKTRDDIAGADLLQ